MLRPGDHVVTTSVEHNSVMRPLRRMEEAGVRITVVPAGADGVTDARDVIAAFRKSTRLVVVTHASNVSGALQPVEDVVAGARQRGILTLVDAAQTAGSVPIDLSVLPVDLLAASGHKGLLGPQGTGFLFVRDGVPIVPLIEGGTGSRSESDRQPEFLPDALESGTQNSVGAAGLAVALAWILRKGVDAIRRKEIALVDRLLSGLSGIPGVTVYGPRDPERRGSAVSFRVEGMDPAETAALLERRSGVLVRAGLHCSPNGHRTLGSFPAGTVRVSPGPFTTRAEIDAFLSALRRIGNRA
ncbi:MAG: aminotransferase class V-fold PLP-dependent enzyme [Deltaproteobacteria bacterium]